MTNFDEQNLGNENNNLSHNNYETEQTNPFDLIEFEEGDESLWNEANEARGGTALSPLRQAILDKFKTLRPGQSFEVPVPAEEKKTTEEFRVSINNMLYGQKMKSRKVVMHPRDKNKIMIGVKK